MNLGLRAGLMLGMVLGVSFAAACGDDGGAGATSAGGAGGAVPGSAAAGIGATTGPAAATGATGAGGSSGAGAPCAPEVARAGEATYYDADGTGNCSFEATTEAVAALNDPDYAAAAWCGACAAVDGPNGSVVVRIVDRCPECASGDLDLSPGAFEQIAPLSAGRVGIAWRFVPCDVEGPVAYRFKEGSNPYWSAIQLRNHRHAVASLEAQDPQTGAFVKLERQDYNFFLWEQGLGEGPYALRATDVHGHVIEDLVPFAEAATAPGAGQFPACP